MSLSEYTTEELKEELLRRRKEEKQKEKALGKLKNHCRECRFLGTISMRGEPITKRSKWDFCCPHKPHYDRNGKIVYYNEMRFKDIACEYFEHK